jgi:hypothetical protein
MSYRDPSGKFFGVDDAGALAVAGGAAVVGGAAAFGGTLLGGGSLGDAFSAIPAGMMGGVATAALASVEAATVAGTLAYEGLAFTINAALDAWAVSDVTGPIPPPTQQIPQDY